MNDRGSILVFMTDSPDATSGHITELHDPKSGSWTGRSVWFLGCRVRRDDAEWCDPAAGCGRHETRSRHPLRCPIPAARGPSGDAPRRDRAGRSSAFRRKVRPRSGMPAAYCTCLLYASRRTLSMLRGYHRICRKLLPGCRQLPCLRQIPRNPMRLLLFPYCPV